MATRAVRQLDEAVDEYKQIVADNIRYWRAVKGWTRQELHDQLREAFGKSDLKIPSMGTLANMETGRHYPEVNHLGMLAHVFGCDLANDLCARPESNRQPAGYKLIAA